MTVVLPVLATTAPSQVLAELKAGGVAADPTETIIRAIEYSHGKLDPALQASLLLLAPFTAVIPSGPALDYYRDALLGDASVQATGAADLGRAVAETVRVGLAAPHPQLQGYVQVQPVLPYFLRSRLRGDSQLQAATAQAHYQLYTALGGQLYELLVTPGDPQARADGQAGTRAEYANLTTALAHGLRTGQPIGNLIFPLDVYLAQAQQHTARRKLLDHAITDYPRPASNRQHRELAQLHHSAGNAEFVQHRLDGAMIHYETELQLLQAIADRRGQAGTYGQLGNVALEQRRFAEAEASYRQALDISLEFENRTSAAGTYHQTRHRRPRAAAVRRGRGQLPAGPGHLPGVRPALCGPCLPPARPGRRGAAAVRRGRGQLPAGPGHQAGVRGPALHGHYLPSARDDRPGAAAVRRGRGQLPAGPGHQAGVRKPALRGPDLPSARHDRPGAVADSPRPSPATGQAAWTSTRSSGTGSPKTGTNHELGTVTQEQRRFAEAEASYRQALDIFLEFEDRPSAWPRPTISST